MKQLSRYNKLQDKNRQAGQISLYVLIFGALAIIVLSGLIIWADLNIKSVNRQLDNSLAFTIAESGIEYYRWHLAHDDDDYQDGTGGLGPYEHEYFDKEGNLIGHFTLEITPPLVGSSVVTIRSTGTIEKDASVEKIIEVKMGIPSLAQYAVVSSSDVRFGPGTEIFGQVHSNGGIRFDGLAHNIITSARYDYNDPDHSGADEYAVHTHISPIDPLPPAPLPARTDVFEAGRQIQVPAFDFTGLTMADLKTDAESGGNYFDDSGDYGYHIVLKTNDTFDIYRVTSIMAPPSGCTNILDQEGWSTWTVGSEVFMQNYAFPANGIIFAEDDIWVDGKINSARLTIVAARLPENPSLYKSITTNSDLLYTNYDGQDVISLLAQKHVNVGLASEDDLRVDAALLAKNGRVGRYYYRPPSGGSQRCSPNHQRNSITSHGMLASNQRYGWAYSNGTGYQIRIINYDANLLYSPPPAFPVTAGTHKIISWKEVK